MTRMITADTTSLPKTYPSPCRNLPHLWPKENYHSRENEIQQQTYKPLGQKTRERSCAVALLSWRAELNGSLRGLVNFLWGDQYRHSRFNGCGDVGGQRQR